MDILKSSTNWAKAELVSTPFFALFGLVFVTAAIFFWQMDLNPMADAYVVPMLVAGAFLLAVGIGLFFTNKSRLNQFEQAHQEDANAFVNAEMERADATLKEYKNVVFTAIPIIIAVCAMVIYFIDMPIWRASMITTIALSSVILIIDGMAHTRIVEYNEQLKAFKENQSND